MSFFAAVDRYWYSPATAQRLALLRIAIGGFALVYLGWRFGTLTSVAHFQPGEFAPVGVVKILTRPLSPSAVRLLATLAIGFGIAFVLGYRYRLTGPLFALSLLWTTSYRNSWGMVFHTENLVVLHVLLLAAAPAADALALDARGRQQLESHGRYGWAIRAMVLVTAAAYVLAGVAKLKFAGLHWLDGHFLREQIAHDNLRKIELGSTHAPWGAELVRHRWPFGALAVTSLCLELGAPVALFGAKLARGWVAGAWAFHVGVALMMAISFPYQLTFIAFLPYFELDHWSFVRSLMAKFGASPVGKSAT